MKIIYAGIDVSKGYSDVVIINDSGSVLLSNRFDDDHEGHQHLREILEHLVRSKHPQRFVVGLESSGGYERNWIKFFSFLSIGAEIKVYCLNPYSMKRFLDQKLHRNTTDRSSAEGIVHYLRYGSHLPTGCFDSEHFGFTLLYRKIRSLISISSRFENELHSLMTFVHPGLVQYCRHGFPLWVLKLLLHYPTVRSLQCASTEQLVRIPFVTEARALDVISESFTSVASQRDDNTADAVILLASELLHFREIIARYKKLLCERMKDDPGVKIISSIPGISVWGATCLRLEIGDIHRFAGPESLVVYAGLDPCIRQSGDTIRYLGISKRGRREIRAILFPLVFCALRCNKPLRDFYSNLRSRGKNHPVSIVACMRKMLYFVYACWISEREFDENRHAEISRRYRQASSESVRFPAAAGFKVTAPVSKREAKKRKAAALPQCGQTAKARGPGAAEYNYTT